MANKRTDDQYEIEALSKGLSVLEVIVDDGPIKESRIVEKTKLGRNLVMRTLKTLKLRGYVFQSQATKEWSIGPRLIRIATDIRG